MRVCGQCGEQFSDTTQFCPTDGAKTKYIATIPPPPGGDTLLGRTLDGRYKIEKMLGEGGMGVVYLATHNVLGKKFAVKVLRPDMAKNEEVVQRFQQEAQSATSIGHPNIIDISDFGKLPDGSVYFVMEFLDGQALTDLVAHSGAIAPARTISIAAQICSALDAAHARGIVHRDLKPDNIYLVQQHGKTDFVKVLDFGIAKVGGQTSKLTKTGMIFGTPHYMSPEQASGQSVDHRADIYAVGVILYEMLTGKLPFDGESFMTILSAHMFQPPPPMVSPSGVSIGPMEAVVMRALAKKPEDRYQTMQELGADLERVSRGDQPTIPPPSAHAAVMPQKFSKPLSDTAYGITPAQTKSKFVAITALAIVVGAVGAYALFSGGGSVPTNDQGAQAGTQNADRNAAQPAAQPAPQHAAPGSGTQGSGAVAQPQLGTPEPPPVAPDVPVTLELRSEPSGAEVQRDDGTILGNTPLTIPRPTAGEIVVEVRLAGYRHKRVVLSAASSSPLQLSLEATPRAAEPVRAGPREAHPRRSGGGEVLDPWNQ